MKTVFVGPPGDIQNVYAGTKAGTILKLVNFCSKKVEKMTVYLFLAGCLRGFETFGSTRCIFPNGKAGLNLLEQ